MEFNIKKIFLTNFGVRQTIFKNTFWLFFSEVAIRLFGLFLVIFAARFLGALEYGKFSFAFAFASIVTILSDFGLSNITTREFSRDIANEKQFPAVLSLKIFLSIIIFAVSFVLSFFVTQDPLVRELIWILSLFLLINNFSLIIYAFFRARQLMEYEAWAKVLQFLSLCVVGFLFIFYFPTSRSLSYTYLIASLAALAFSLALFYFKIQPIKIKIDLVVWKKFLTFAWPVAFTGVFVAFYEYINSIMMGHLGQITQTGWYNAADKITNIMPVLVSLISLSFYPMLNKYYQESKEKLQNIWSFQVKLMIFLAIPFIAGGIFLGSRIINFFYGASYSPAILVFQVLAVGAALACLCEPFIYILIVFHQQKKYFYISLVGGIVNVVLNLIFIPKYSLYGAAAVNLTTYIVLLFLFLFATKKFTYINPFRMEFLGVLLISIISAFFMSIAVLSGFLRNLNAIILVLIGTVIYVVIFAVLNKFKKYYGRLSGL